MHHQAVPMLEEEPAVERGASRAPSRWRRRTWFVAWRLLAIAAFVAVAVVAYRAGQELRVWAWKYTAAIHFFPDMNNGYYWGSQAWESPDPRNRNLPPPGIVNVYDVVAARSPDHNQDGQPDYGLDYAPLRLTLISQWVKWGREAHPEWARTARIAARGGSNSSYWEAPYEFYEPLLHFNTAMEIVGVVGLFLLARHWVVRGWRGKAKPDVPEGRRWPWFRVYDWFTSDRPFRGWIAGAVAGLLFWFSPAILLSAHGWPTWDMWVIPFFVWAIYLACIDFWFLAGVVIAAGAMFKGQQLIVAPLFLLWPIFAGRPLMAVRWAAGCVFGIGAIAAPWLLTHLPDGVQPTIGSRVLDRPAVMWLAAIAVATLLLPPLLRRLRPWRKHDWHPLARWATWGGALLVIAACAWGPFRGAGLHWAIGMGFAVLVVAGAALLPIRWTPILAAASLGIALLLCGKLYQGSLHWLDIGWGYGTRHYPKMQVGMCDNLAGLLEKRFGWRPNHEASLFNGAVQMPIRSVLIWLYVIAFVPCVAGAALHYRRNDPRFLVAITATWVVFFAFLPQMHERYLIYAAGVSCALTAVGTGFTLLGVLMTIWTTVMTFHPMLSVAAGGGRLTQFLADVSPTASNTLYQFVRLAHPDAGWAVVLIALIFVYASLAPSKRSLA